jgi:hypothetical protein
MLCSAAAMEESHAPTPLPAAALGIGHSFADDRGEGVLVEAVRGRVPAVLDQAYSARLGRFDAVARNATRGGGAAVHAVPE